VRMLGFSSDGHATATGFSAANLIRWNVGREPPRVHPLLTGTERKIVSLDTRASALSASGDVLAVAMPASDILLLDIGAPEDRQPLTARARLMDLRQQTGLLTVALSPDGRRMVSGYRGGTVAIWDLTTQHPLARSLLGNHKDLVTAVAFAPDGKTIVSGSDDKTLIRWDAETLRAIGAPLEGHKSNIETVAVSPDGTLIASGDVDGAIMLWDVAAGRAAGPRLPGHGDQLVNRVVFSPDGSLLASGGRDGRLMLWDVRTRQSLGALLEDPKWSISGAAFSPDGKVLASGTVGSMVTLWDVARRQPLGAPVTVAGKQAADHFVFRRDGKLLVSQGNISLNVWDLSDGRTLGSPTTLDPIDRERRQGQGGGLAMNPEGTLIVTGGDNRLVLWDVASGQPLERVLWGWRGSSTRLAMSPDGTVVAASHDNEVLLWDVGLASWQRRACAIVNRDLTQAEWNKFVGPELPYRRTCSELPVAR
jgi:WD40 repeat protein